MSLESPIGDRFNEQIGTFQFTCHNTFYRYVIDARPWKIYREFRKTEQALREKFLTQIGYRYFMIVADKPQALFKLTLEIIKLRDEKLLSSQLRPLSIVTECPQISLTRQWSKQQRDQFFKFLKNRDQPDWLRRFSERLSHQRYCTKKNNKMLRRIYAAVNGLEIRVRENISSERVEILVKQTGETERKVKFWLNQPKRVKESLESLQAEAEDV